MSRLNDLDEVQAGFIDAATLARWLDEVGALSASELALIDVREAGRFGEGHALLAINIPYSRLELDIARLVPRLGTRTVLIGDTDAASVKAVRALQAQGYRQVLALAGGTSAWQASGQLLLQGVNVPSKAFAEFVEHVYHTPDIEPAELRALQDSGADLVLLDSRTVEEYRRFHVPGAISCPGSELVLRFDDLVSSPHTRVVITCAGRTRGVMGAQTLINASVPNRVQALSGGTQGWTLAGLPLAHVSEREYGEASPAARARGAQRAAHVAGKFDITTIDAATLQAWRTDGERTTYVFDIRPETEYLAGHWPGAVWAQGVQLIQCIDQWAAVRGARVVLSDDDGTRATLTAHWLRQLGWDAVVLRAGASGLTDTAWPQVAAPALPAVAQIAARDAAERLRRGALLVDAGASAAYRSAHAAGAVWANRSATDALWPRVRQASELIVLGADDRVAQLLALEFAAALPVSVLKGGLTAWQRAGLPVESTPGVPADVARIDFLFWLHDRHEGNQAASAAYLKWEAELPATIGDASVAGLRFPA